MATLYQILNARLLVTRVNSFFHFVTEIRDGRS